MECETGFSMSTTTWSCIADAGTILTCDSD